MRLLSLLFLIVSSCAARVQPIAATQQASTKPSSPTEAATLTSIDTLIIARPVFKDSSMHFHSLVCGPHWNCETLDDVIVKHDPINLVDFKECLFINENVKPDLLSDESKHLVDATVYDPSKTAVYASFSRLSDTSAVYKEYDDSGNAVLSKQLHYDLTTPLESDTIRKETAPGKAKLIVWNKVEVR